MMKYDVSVVGPLNIDLIVVGEGPKSWDAIRTFDGPAEMEMVAAGSVGYTVRDFSRLGLKAKVFSCVPDDSLGTFIIENLDQDGVDTSGVQKISGTAAGIGVYMLIFGDRKRPLSYRLPSHKPWPVQFTPDEVDDLLNTRLLHCGGYLHFKEMYHGSLVEIYQEAHRRGVMTAIDPQFPLHAMNDPWISAMEDVLPYTDILLCDDHEARCTTGYTDLKDCAKTLLDRGPQVVIIKQGDKGADLFTPQCTFHQKAVRAGELVDSIGAGDAFDASFLYSRLQGWDLEKCARFAATTAGITVTGMGGCATMPSADQVKRILGI